MRFPHLILAATVAAVAAVAVTGPALAGPHAKNGLIAFGAVTNDEGTQLFTVRPNGHDLRKITYGPGAAIHPDWSPDGRSIVYEHDWDTETLCATVDRIDSDGSNRVSLTSGVGGCQGQPAFTPWGAIVYENFDFGTEDDGIWGMNGNGAGSTRSSRPGLTGPASSPIRTSPRAGS